MNDSQGSLAGESSDLRNERIGVLQFELGYRRSKQDSVFSWGSAILVTIIGGVLLLGRDTSHPITQNQRIFISAAIVGLTLFAVLWLGYNARRESVTATQLEGLTGCELRDKKQPKPGNSRDTEQPKPGERLHKKATEDGELTASLFVGYRLALILLAAAAVFVSWCWK